MKVSRGSLNPADESTENRYFYQIKKRSEEENLTKIGENSYIRIDKAKKEIIDTKHGCRP